MTDLFQRLARFVRSCAWASCLAVVSTAPAQHDLAASHGYPLATVHTTDDYRQHEQNWGVLQADNGLIYVANGYGLMEWDGERWRTYPTPSKTRLRAIARWSDGRVYTGTPNDIGYYQTSSNGGLAFFSLLQGWSDDQRNFGEIWSVASNSQWVVFVAVDHLYVYDGQDVHVVDGIAPGTYRVFSVGERILIKQQKSPHLLELVRDDEFQMRVVSEQLPTDAFPMAIYADGADWIVVTATRGILRVTETGRSEIHPPQAFGEGVVLFSSFVDVDGYHYVGTLKHGLFVINPAGQLIRNYRSDDGIGTNTILAIAGDDQGNIWISGAPVITRFTPTHRASRHTTEDNSQSLQMLVRHQGRIYLAGFGFYVMTESDSPLSPPAFELIEGTNNNQIWDAISVGEDLLLATNHGVNRIRLNANAEIVEEEFLVKSAFAYDIVRIGDSSVFFAATHDGLDRLEQSEDGTWRTVRLPGVDRAMRHLAAESENTLWVASEDHRIYRIADIDPYTGQADITRFDQADGLGDTNLFPLVLDGTVLIGSDDGIMQYAEFEQRLRAEPSLTALLEQLRNDDATPIVQFLPDAAGRLWIQTGNDRFVAQRKNGQWQTSNQIFSSLPPKKIESVFDYHDDEIWLVLEQDGLHTIDPHQVDAAVKQPVLHIRSAEDLDSNDVYYLGYGVPDLPELTQQNNSIRFHYALADFRTARSSPVSTHQYRTRLLGSGADQWADWTGEDSKDYTLLGGGHYVFEVQARNQIGQVSQIARLAFAVAPPWYLSRPAVVLYLLGAMLTLALAVLAGSKWRKRKTRAKQLELRQLVEERTAALAQANRKLQKLANSDGLTGLANRRQFDTFLRQLIDDGLSASLIMIDVDHFKRYNDEHGHLAGDDLLKTLADILRQTAVPENSLAARYGGEEFALVLPEVTEDGALTIGQNLRGSVQERLGVTVSIGVAHRPVRTDEDALGLIDDADHALYEAKEGGRNRVISNVS